MWCSELLSPLSGGGFGLLWIVLKHFVDFLVEWVLQIGRLHHYLNGHKDSLYIVTRIPSRLVLVFTLGRVLCLEHAEADLAVSVHVRMVDFAPEDALGWH